MGVPGSGFVNRSLWNDCAGDMLPLPGWGVEGLCMPLLGVSEPDGTSRACDPDCCSCCCSLFTCSSFWEASIFACCLLFWRICCWIWKKEAIMWLIKKECNCHRERLLALLR